MRTLNIIGLAVLAVCALSIAVVAPASASVFLASAVNATIKGNQLNTQVFKTDAGNVECTKAKGSGTTLALSAKSQAATVTYTGCSAFGSGVTVSPAEYQFNADHTVNVLNTIVVTSSIGKCSVKVGAAGNQNLKDLLKFIDPDNADAIIIKSHVSNISYLATGGICGPTGELKNGIYNGELLVFIEEPGGKIAWDD